MRTKELMQVPVLAQECMEVIEFPGYIEEEKLEIARRFLIPRQLEESGLEPGEIEQGFILTCQAHPISDRVVVDFDQK